MADIELVVKIPEELKQAVDNDEEYRLYTESVGHVTMMAIKYGKSLDAVLDEIKAKIEDESYLSYDDNPRHIIDESWVLDIIDKYKEEESKKERDDLWMNKIFDQDKINAKTEQWTKEAKKEV